MELEKSLFLINSFEFMDVKRLMGIVLNLQMQGMYIRDKIIKSICIYNKLTIGGNTLRLKLSKSLLLVLFLISFITSSPDNTEASMRVMWGKTELKLGQTGKVTILDLSELVTLKSDGSLSSVRTLKKGEEFRVYSYKREHGGLYGVGGGSYVKKSNKVKYETPSKGKLAALKEASQWTKIKPNLNLNTNIGINNYSYEATIQLLNGNVMLIGKEHSFIYDYKLNTWNKIAQFNQKGEHHSPVMLQDGRVMVFTGHDGIKRKLFSNAEIYDPKTNKWSKTGKLKKERNINVNTVLLPNGNILIAGATEVEDEDYVEIYNPKTNTWSSAAVPNYFNPTSLLFVPLENGNIMTIGGRSYIEGTDSFIGKSIETAVEIYDYKKNEWSFLGLNKELNVMNDYLILSDKSLFLAGSYHFGIYKSEDNEFVAAGGIDSQFDPSDILEISPGKVLVVGELSDLQYHKPKPAGYIYEVKTGKINKINIPVISPKSYSLPNGKVLVMGTSIQKGLNSKMDWNTMYLYTPDK